MLPPAVVITIDETPTAELAGILILIEVALITLKSVTPMPFIVKVETAPKLVPESVAKVERLTLWAALVTDLVARVVEDVKVGEVTLPPGVVTTNVPVVRPAGIARTI